MQKDKFDQKSSWPMTIRWRAQLSRKSSATTSFIIYAVRILNHWLTAPDFGGTVNGEISRSTAEVPRWIFGYRADDYELLYNILHPKAETLDPSLQVTAHIPGKVFFFLLHSIAFFVNNISILIPGMSSMQKRKRICTASHCKKIGRNPWFGWPAFCLS